MSIVSVYLLLYMPIRTAALGGLLFALAVSSSLWAKGNLVLIEVKGGTGSKGW
jgi:hypothetical protein